MASPFLLAEKGNQILNLISRIDLDDFEGWLASFSRQSLSSEGGDSCKPVSCDGDQLPWVDGKCYQVNYTVRTSLTYNFL